MAYTTQSKILQYLGLSALPSPITGTTITELIKSVTAFINTYCNRTFEEESVTTKLYSGDGSKTLLIDDLLTLSKIETLDANNDVDITLDNSDYYFLEPANKTPKQKIIINSSTAPIGRFPKGNQNIKLTGTFGNAVTVPADIELVATKLVAEILNDYNVTGGEVTQESLGEYSISYADISNKAKVLGSTNILNFYRRLSV